MSIYLYRYSGPNAESGGLQDMIDIGRLEAVSNIYRMDVGKENSGQCRS